MQRSLPSKKAKTSMGLKFENSSVLFKPMSYLYHLKGRANQENSQISRRIGKTSRKRIEEIPHHLKWSRALSAKGMGM